MKAGEHERLTMLWMKLSPMRRSSNLGFKVLWTWPGKLLGTLRYRWLRANKQKYINQTLIGLLGEANKIRSFRSSRTRTVAILGDSGEGKSSLVNSLLHFPGIAKASDAGMACTSVVTEYYQKQQHHTAKITIEVEYLSDSDMEEFIEELVWSYRQLFLKEWTEGDKDFIKQEAESDTAWSALNAAFGHRGNLKSLFGDDSSEGLKTIKDRLLEWCSDLAWPEASNSGSWSSTAEPADECWDKTAVFMSDRL